MSEYEETVYPLPKGWAWSTLGACAELITKGESPKWQGFDYVEIGVPFIRSENVLWGSVAVEQAARVPRQFHEKLRRSQLKGKDLLVNLVGASIGRCAVLPQTIIEGNVNQAVGVVRFEDKWIRPEYVRDWLLSPVMQHHINGQKVETARANISLEDLRSMPIPLAPTAEQDRIIFTVDQLLTQLDSAVMTLKRVQLQLKRYRQSVLKHAVEGKLTAEWREKHKEKIEPADDLVKRILAERRAKWEEHELAKMKASGKVLKDQSWKKKYDEPQPPNTEGLPELPEGWCWTNVATVSQLMQYGTSEKASPSPGGMIVLRMGNIQDGELVFHDLKYMPADWQQTEEFLLTCGDILFNRTNSAELVGKTAVYQEHHPEAVFASYLIRVRPNRSACVPEFLSLFINSYHGRLYIASVVSQQVGQANVNGTKLSSMPVPLPPYSEQCEIMSRVDELLSTLAEAKSTVELGLARSERLRKSILHLAFSGRLVPQCPGDEPASMLLVRIRAEREKEANGKRRVRASPRTAQTRRTRQKRELHKGQGELFKGQE